MAGTQTTALKQAQREASTPDFVGKVLLVGLPPRPEVEAALEARGFQVVRTDSVVQALTLAVASRVTLLITGPGEVGASLLEGLRSLPTRPDKRDLPLIWLGSEADDEDALLRQGVSLFLAPPYPVEHLITAAMFSA